MHRVARNFQLRLNMRQTERPRVTFDGFKRDVRGSQFAFETALMGHGVGPGEGEADVG